jgi:hypothetical protein
VSSVGLIAPELAADAQYVRAHMDCAPAALSVATGAERWWIGDYQNVHRPTRERRAHVYASSSTGYYALRR